MIKCPKCGFEQPEDVFCASCGVNIKAHSLKAQKKNRRLVTASVVASITIVLALVYWFLNQETLPTEQAQTAVELETTPKPQSSEQAEKRFVGKKILNQNSAVAAASGMYTDTSSQTNTSQETPPALESTPSSNTVLITSKNKFSNQITVHLALATMEAVEKLGLRMGTAGSSFFNVKPNTGLTTLSSETHGFDEQMLARFYQLTQEPQTRENIGLQIEIQLVTPPSLQQNQTHSQNYKIAIRRSLIEQIPGSPIRVVSQDFTENTTLTADQGLAISGLLPRKPVTEEEARLYGGNILRVLVDPRFLKLEQEFVVLISQ